MKWNKLKEALCVCIYKPTVTPETKRKKKKRREEKRKEEPTIQETKKICSVIANQRNIKTTGQRSRRRSPVRRRPSTVIKHRLRVNHPRHIITTVAVVDVAVSTAEVASKPGRLARMCPAPGPPFEW